MDENMNKVIRWRYFGFIVVWGKYLLCLISILNKFLVINLG